MRGYGGSSSLEASIGLKKFTTEIESIVICKASGPIQTEYLANGVQCEVFEHMFNRTLPKYNFRNLLTSIKDLHSLFRLHRKICEIEPDVVHFNYAGLMFNGLLLKLTGFQGKIIIHSRFCGLKIFCETIYFFIKSFV